MKNIGKRLLAAALILSVALLSGCGNDKKEKENTDGAAGATSSGASSSSKA